ncbi:MAG: hypothetical protein CMJ78_23110 [Planctomycetaceae bacterium]|nr:hypothetical protein [Planctomycetaceae bacterium]
MNRLLLLAPSINFGQITSYAKKLWLVLIASLLSLQVQAIAEDAPKAALLSQEAEQVVSRIEQLGGKVRYAAAGMQDLEVDFRFSNEKFNDAELAALSKLANVTVLRINGTGVTDKGLRHVAKLPSLKRLDLAKTVVTGIGLKQLTGLKQLESLNLYATKVGDRELLELAKLQKLKTLYIEKTHITEPGIAAFKKLAAGVTVVPDMSEDRRRAELLVVASQKLLHRADSELTAFKQDVKELFPRLADFKKDQEAKKKTYEALRKSADDLRKKRDAANKSSSDAEKAASKAQKESKAKPDDEKLKQAAKKSQQQAEEAKKNAEKASAAYDDAKQKAGSAKRKFDKANGLQKRAENAKKNEEVARKTYNAAALRVTLTSRQRNAFTKPGKVSFSVSEPTGVVRDRWPITSGIPLHRGVLFDAEATTLVSAEGDEIPLQTEALSRWPDGSIRWLLLDFQATFGASQTRKFSLQYGPALQRKAGGEVVAVEESKDRIELNTGPLRVELSSKDFRLLNAVWLDRDGNGEFADDERLTTNQDAGIILTTPDGKSFHADASDATMEVEQAGPLRACVRIAGKHSNKDGSMFRYIVRVHAFAGRPYLKINYTFVNDNERELMSKVDSLELVFAASGADNNKSILDGQVGGNRRLFQVDDQSYEINAKSAGKRAAGWVAIGNQQGGVAIGVREFWQNWPKSLEAHDNLLRVGICPKFEKGRYDGKPIKEEAKLYYYLRDGDYSFKIGVSRTHEVWAHLFSGEPSVETLNSFYRAVDLPLLAQPSPDYVSQTQAAGDFQPAKKSAAYARYDAWLDATFQLHLADLENVREYGLLNFGDWYNIKWDSWGNLEYDTARCFAIQYLRTGDRRYFDRASQAARHYLDVDVVHEISDGLHKFPGSAKMRPGHIWLHQLGHTGGYYGRYDGEKYHDEAPLIMKGAYQVGMYNFGHHWIGGVFDYYMLTGDRRALEVAKMSADTLAADCPTRYTDHIRDLGWPLNFVVAAYEATGKQEYLDAATRQWKLLQKHFDAEKGFQVMLAYGHCNEPSTAKRCHGQNAYMLALTMSGLARYHRLTQDPEALKGLTAGLNQLVRECWSEKHKSFYLSSCIHNRDNPPPALCSVTALSAEAFAYEAAITGNAEHRRIWREAFETMVTAGLESAAKGDQQGQTGYSSMMFHFTPFGFRALEPR